MAETSLIKLVAIHPTAGTAAPTRPAKLSSLVNATLISAGWTTIGSRKMFSNDCDLGDGEISQTMSRIYEEIKAPRNMGIEDHLLIEIAAAMFEFDCYDNSADLWALDSNLTIASGVESTFTATVTKRAVLVEVQGLGFSYYPQCVVAVTDHPGGFGEGGVVKPTIQVMPEQTTAIPSGKKVYWYE